MARQPSRFGGFWTGMVDRQADLHPRSDRQTLHVVPTTVARPSAARGRHHRNRSRKQSGGCLFDEVTKGLCWPYWTYWTMALAHLGLTRNHPIALMFPTF